MTPPGPRLGGPKKLPLRWSECFFKKFEKIVFDEKTQTPFVEIKIDNQTFDRRDVKLGISDGINVELISGVNKDEEIKVWNITVN